MGHVELDLFELGAKQHLICVDHWSGYPMLSSLSYYFNISEKRFENMV